MTREELEKRVHEFTVQVYKEGYKQGLEQAEMGTKTRVKVAYAEGLEDAWECARKILDAVVPYDYWDIGSGNHISSVIKHYSASEAMQKIKEYEQQKQKCEDCFTEKLTKEKWASAEDCKECKKQKQDEKIDIRAEYEKYYMPIGNENMRRKREQREQGETPLCTYTDSEVAKSFIEDVSAVEEQFPRQTDATDSYEIKVGDEVVFCDSFHGARYVVVRIRDDGTFEALCDCGTDDGLDLKKCHKTGRQFPQIAEILRQLRGEI